MLAAIPALGLGVLLAGVTGTPVHAADASPAATAEYSRTQTLTRTHVQADGTDDVVDSRAVTVDVDTTTNLRGRQRIGVSWSGAHPSASRTSNPYGQAGMTQEYPVVILQCRGLDDPSLPANQQISPSTCWTSDYVQRKDDSASSASAPWLYDRFATASDKVDQKTLPTWPADCPLLPASFPQHLVPFVAKNGTTYPACTQAAMPAEAALDGALPAAEVSAYTATNGTGSWQFEVRSDQENESLGCSSDVPCSLVVIPIMGISCDGTNVMCRAAGRAAPGSRYNDELGVDLSVQPELWWSASNWRGRFAVPLTFGLPADACDVLDSRAPVDFYGSELLAQASLQWAPAYCLRQDRFKFRHNRMTDSAALRLVDSGGAVAAFVSDPATTTKQLAYAPTAVTGFGIAFVIDRPNNAGEQTQLRLTPRLLAKLLSQSYVASNNGKGHPGMAKNPVSINLDPEFTALNPGLDDVMREAAATVLSLSEGADTMRALTAYIASDAEATAFLKGTPDPWGMVVNPDFQSLSGAGVQLPTDSWPLLDTWKLPKPSDVCWTENISTPYFALVAAPVNTLRKVATALIDAWPNVQTRCEGNPTAGYKVGRVDRQNYGTRFMLGIVSLGDADRYGLRVASLRTTGTGADATFVDPSSATMAKAVATATSAGLAQAFTLDSATMPSDAYPGTMIVHTAAPTSGLSTSDAASIGQFIATATTEGQVPGSANGELPDGFLPILPTGATAQLYAGAQAAGAIIVAQQGTPASAPASATSGTSTTDTSDGSVVSTGSSGPPATGIVDSSGAESVTVDGLPAPAASSSSSTSSGVVTAATPMPVAGLAVPVAAGIGLWGALMLPLALWLGSRRGAL